MNGKPWGAEDDDALMDLVGDVPLAAVIKRFQQWCTDNDRPPRTKASIIHRIRRLGLHSRSTGQWITIGAVARAVGVSGERVREWILHRGADRYGLKGQLKADRFPLRENRRGTKLLTLWWVNRTDLRAFAVKNPRLFGHLDRMDLVALLDDENAADAVLATAAGDRGMAHPVRCIDTGVSYPSLAAAARANYLTESWLSQAVRRDGCAGGLRWELI